VSQSNALSPQQRRQRNRAEVTEAIVVIAREMMREEGVAALNLSEIARRLGMRTPSLYEYFPNKLALVDHLFLLGMRQFRQMMQTTDQLPAQSPWEKLEQFLTAHLQFAVDNPELFKLLFERHIPGFVPSDASMAESYAALAEADAYLTAFLESIGIDAGAATQQMRDLLVVIMDGLSAQHLANEPHLPVGQGRFGSLIPFVVETLKKAWQKEAEQGT
jgi:AcrR family transcriptional regulator